MKRWLAKAWAMDLYIAGGWVVGTANAFMAIWNISMDRWGYGLVNVAMVALLAHTTTRLQGSRERAREAKAALDKLVASMQWLGVLSQAIETMKTDKEMSFDTRKGDMFAVAVAKLAQEMRVEPEHAIACFGQIAQLLTRFYVSQGEPEKADPARLVALFEAGMRTMEPH